ncbi:MAG: hypothetical protein ACXWB2_10300 [Acidimicrobiales bacterium]
MFKRTIWFTVGAASGAGASVYAYVRLREERGRLAPDRVADTLVGTARTVGRGARTVGLVVGDNVRAAVADGRSAMTEVEARITAEIEGRPRPARRDELIASVRPRSDDGARDSDDGRVRRAQ